MTLFQSIDAALRVERLDSAPNESTSSSFLKNADLRPVEPARRTWGAFSFVAYWISDGLNLSTFVVASTAVSMGLTWWAAWLAVIAGYTLVALVIVLAARIAAVYHVSFPVLARSTFGIWGAIWPVLNRSAMACVWYGVQAWIGGECVTLVLQALAPDYVRLHNSLPSSSGIQTHQFLSFFLFCLVSLPIVCMSPERVKWFFIAKSIVVPIAAFAFFGLSIKDANGLGPILQQPATISGSAYGWTFVATTSNCISSWATLALNIPDVARLAKSKSSVTWSQLLAIPLTSGITSFLGIIIASSSKVIYGETIWNPVDLLGERLKRNPYGAADRAGVFFIALIFIMGQIGVNVAANSLSAGHDLTAILPRYINIRRGSLIAAAVGFAMCPWHLLADSNSFATYLSAYSLFLSSISGTMMCDYYIVRRGVLDVGDMYSARRDGAYRYLGGFNLRAFASYMTGMVMTVTGFAGVLGAEVSEVAQNMFTLAYPIGFFMSGLMYLLLCSLFPVIGGYDVRKHGTAFYEPESYEDEMWWPDDRAQQLSPTPQLPTDSKDEEVAEKKPNVSESLYLV